MAKEVTLPYYSSADLTPEWIEEGSGRLDTLHSIPAFSFTDQNGNTISEKDVTNKIYVADFFFTACPGICPKLAKNLKLVQDAFANDDEVLLLSHSVTPDKDIPAVLKRYARNYSVIDSKWHLLTGNKDSIYNIARRSYFADEDLGMQRNSNDFLHTENMLLIDKHRRIRGVYKGTSAAEMDNIIADIKKLKAQKY
ncbi:MAG TPA: SCO family protein [Ferruginibacter sp.]|nr:SCO family protein [Ferruginibacter sp.]